MTTEQIAALLRTLIQVTGGIVGWTWMDDSTAIAVAGMGATVLTTAWGIWARSKTNLIASAAAQQEVTRIVAEPAVAHAVPSPKVVDPMGLPSATPGSR